jgi:exodeoxyribonuclease-5
MWQVAEVKRSTKKDREKGHTRLSVKADEEGSTLRNIDVKVRDEFWTGDEAHLSWEDKKGTDEFTYGYAITCHKSQGSQWENVLVFDEAASFREDAWRWRYTAITRAATKLTVVVNK